MIIKTLFIGYAILCIAIFVFQRKLLYLPDKQFISEKLALSSNLIYWQSDQKDFQGFISSKKEDKAKKTIIVFHGNAGSAYDRSFYVNALSNKNLRVILAEYPGYGGRAGKPSEKVLVNDALKTIKLAYQKYKTPLFIWGESLGAAVTSAVVKKARVPIQGLVLFLPWDSLANVAQTHYWYLPARWLVLDKYKSIENLKEFKGNIAVVLAQKDEVIPIKHGKKLYDSIRTNKKLWVFENSRHNNVPIGPNQAWLTEVIEFISQ